MPVDNQLAPDLQIEEGLIQQRQKLADILAGRAFTPINAPHMTVASPWQAAAKIYAGYKSGQIEQQVRKDQVALGEKYNTRLQEGVADYVRHRYGTGVQPDPQEVQQSQDQGTPPPAPAGAPANPRAMMIEAMASRNPRLQAIASADYARQNELDKPRIIPSDSTLHYPAGERPDLVGAPKKAIPDNWASFLPPGAERQPNDPNGIFRLKGPDGQADVYSMEFEGSKVTGYKRLDNGPNPLARGNMAQYHFVPTAQGLWAINNSNPADKHLVQDPNGKPILAVPADAALAGRKAEVVAAGHEAGKLTQDQLLALPKTIANGELALKHIDDMVGTEDKKTPPHPGFSSTVGWTWKPGFRFIEGSKEADFMKRLKQTEGGAFLDAYNTLKGGGAITEIEGKKGTDAIQRLGKSQSEKEFITAAREFQEVLRAGIARAKALAAQAPIQPGAAPAAAPAVQPGLPMGAPGAALVEPLPKPGAAPAPGSVMKFDAQGNLIP